MLRAGPWTAARRSVWSQAELRVGGLVLGRCQPLILAADAYLALRPVSGPEGASLIQSVRDSAGESPGHSKRDRWQAAGKFAASRELRLGDPSASPSWLRGPTRSLDPVGLADGAPAPSPAAESRSCKTHH